MEVEIALRERKMKESMPFVSVITVNYNGKRFLKECSDSLHKLNYPASRIEIIMVDNCSKDDSVEYVRRYYPKVKIIQNDINNYCRANNLGIKEAGGDYIALVNNDTKATEDWLIELIKLIEQDAYIGAVGSKILFMDGRIQSVGHQEHPNFYWIGGEGFKEEDKGQYDQIKEVTSLCGSSVIYRRGCLEDVGLLDEDFNMYLEDVEMGIRCRKKGWKLKFCPTSVIYHELHGTIGSQDRALYHKEKNRLLLVAKHWPEKMPLALAGKSYFSTRGDYSNSRDISEILGAVFLKLIKEHGIEVAERLRGELFEEVRKMYNFEKNQLLQHVVWLEKEREQLSKDNIELKGAVDTKEQEKRFLEEQKILQLQGRDRQLNLLQKEAAEQLEACKKENERRVQALTVELEHTRKELDGIYGSTGFRYFLRPVWNFLWPIRQAIKRFENSFIRSIGARIRFLWDIMAGFTQTCFIYLYAIIKLGNSLLNRNGKREAYLNHIQSQTFPPLPERLTLMLNRNCNLKCAFCDIEAKTEKDLVMAKEDALHIIDKAYKLGVNEVIFTGGEPLSHPDIFEIISFTKSKNISAILTTNGVLIKSRIEEILKSGIDCVGVSIDGREETHDRLRNCQGVFKQAMEAINLLRRHEINVSVNCLITNKNISDLDYVYKYFSKLGIKVSFLPVINKPDLFPSTPIEQKKLLSFFRRLRAKRYISSEEYNYLRLAIEGYFNGKDINVRCLGLNMEFGIDTNGDIAPCCVWENRRSELNNLGNALKDDIEKLWHSPHFHQVRASIFLKGCQNCFNPSIFELTEKTKVNFLIHSQKKKIHKPTHVHMRFTSRCNLQCRHCDIWKDAKATGKELTIDEWKSCIDKLYSWLGVFKLDLAGGEILLYPHTVPLIKYCAKKGIRVNLTTNATLIGDAIAEKLVDTGLYCINLSLDGLPDIHGYIRNRKDAFFEVRKAAFNLRKYKKLNIPYIGLTTVITKQNLDQLEEIVCLPKKWGIDNTSFQVLDHNFGAQYNAEWFRNNEFWPDDFPKLEKAIDILIDAKKSGACIDNTLEQLNAMKEYYRNPIEMTGQRCTTGINNFIINEFGEVLLCWNMMPVGKLLLENPDTIWNGQKAFKRREEIEACQRTCRMLNCNYSEKINFLHRIDRIPIALKRRIRLRKV